MFRLRGCSDRGRRSLRVFVVGSGFSLGLGMMKIRGIWVGYYNFCYRSYVKGRDRDEYFRGLRERRREFRGVKGL